MYRYAYTLGMGVFIVLLLFLLIFLFKLRIGLNLKLDLRKNVGSVCISLFGLKVLNKSFKVVDLNSILSRKKGSEFFLKVINNGMLERIWLTNLYIDALVGVKENALLTAVYSSMANNVISRIILSLKEKKDPSIYKNIYSVFNKDVFQFNIKGIIGVSVADIISSIFIKKRGRLYDNRT